MAKHKLPKNRDNKYLPQIGVRLPHDQVKALDQRVEKSRGRYNRSDLIRQAIDRYLVALPEEG